MAIQATPLPVRELQREKSQNRNQRNRELEMETMASAIGTSVPVLCFLICFIATFSVSAFWRLVPSGKHLYAAFTGALLPNLSFGFASNLYFLIPILLSYASMVFVVPWS